MNNPLAGTDPSGYQAKREFQPENAIDRFKGHAKYSHTGNGVRMSGGRPVRSRHDAAKGNGAGGGARMPFSIAAGASGAVGSIETQDGIYQDAEMTSDQAGSGSSSREEMAEELLMGTIATEQKNLDKTVQTLDTIGDTAILAQPELPVGKGVRFVRWITKFFRKADRIPAGTGARFRGREQLDDHFQRHGGDFNARDAAEYERRADGFLTGQPDANTLEKVRENGDIVRYNPDTEEFGVVSENGVLRTYFVPDPKVHGKGSNLDYFNEQ